MLQPNIVAGKGSQDSQDVVIVLRQRSSVVSSGKLCAEHGLEEKPICAGNWAICVDWTIDGVPV